jgi:hypothetical protein
MKSALDLLQQRYDTSPLNQLMARRQPAAMY